MLPPGNDNVRRRQHWLLSADNTIRGTRTLVEREIETRLGRLKTDRKKVRLAKARTQRQDIKDLSRNPVLYPIEMST